VRRILVCLLAVALLAPAAASAAEIRDLETGGYPTFSFIVVGDEPSSLAPTVMENGKAVDGLKTKNLARAKSVVLAIDRSRSMLGEPLADAVAAARAFIAAKPPEDRIAVVTYATAPLQLTDFSTATIDADTALRSIAVDQSPGTKLYDGIVMAAGALAAEPLPARVIVAVTDGDETLSEATLEEAIDAATGSGVSVYVIGIESARFDPLPLQRLAEETGGSYHAAATSDALAEVYSSIAEELERTWQIEYVTNARPLDRLNVEVTLSGGDRATAKFAAPPVEGALGESPEESPLLPEFFYTSDWGLPLFGLVVGILVLIAAVLGFASPRGSWLKGRLEPHVAGERRRAIKQQTQRRRFAFAAGLFRATEGAFGGLRLYRRVQTTLERADLPLRAGEFIYIMAASGVLVSFFAAAFFRSALAVGVGFALGMLVPYGFASYKARKRLRDFEDLLPDILVTMAASLKAGHSFRQGVQSVVDEGQEPASKEFKRVLTETQLGRPMDDALAEMAVRVGSKDFMFVMNAVNIQRTVGGSLAGLFDMVADTVRQRHQFRRKIRGLTAMGRASAYVLVGLPFLVFGAIWLINTEYMKPLITTSTGHKLILITFGMMTVGSLILKKIVSFKG
jgi:tight adherence protein B